MIYTMGFTQKSAERFFELIKEHRIRLLIDVRLNNKSQLAGFTKQPDLAYFLNQICGCEYRHEVMFAPTKEILDDYKKGKMPWGEYERKYNELLTRRKASEYFADRYGDAGDVLFMCSEPTPECCHRRLLAEFISKDTKETIKHI